jgi:hypothetical protein
VTKNYWPCTLVEHDDASPSLIFDDFDRIEAKVKTGRDLGGYFVERLVKRLAREAGQAGLLKRVKFDPEASLLAAYGDDREALYEVAALLRRFVGGRAPKVVAKPVFDEKAAEKQLLKGFIKGLDPAAQQAFYALVPKSAATAEDLKRLAALKARSAVVRKEAARRLNSQARSHTTGSNLRFESALGDPRTTEAMISALGLERDEAVFEELIGALAFVCSRHLPDLRALEVFEAAYTHPRANVRRLAVMGAAALYRWSWSRMGALLDDRSAGVRGEVLSNVCWGKNPFAIWLFTVEHQRASSAKTPEKLRPRIEHACLDPDAEVARWARQAL